MLELWEKRDKAEVLSGVRDQIADSSINLEQPKDDIENVTCGRGVRDPKGEDWFTETLDLGKAWKKKRTSFINKFLNTVSHLLRFGTEFIISAGYWVNLVENFIQSNCGPWGYQAHKSSPVGYF